MENLKFKTSIDSSSVWTYGYNHIVNLNDLIDINFGKIECVVEWELLPEIRNWGVKSLSAVIYNVKITMPWEIYYDDEDTVSFNEREINIIEKVMGGVKHPTKNLYEGVLTINSQEAFNGNMFEVINNIIGENQFGGYYPDTCEINFDDMTIEIS